MGEEPKRSTGEDVATSYRKAGPYLDASWQLTGAVAFWTFIGWFADGRLGTKPWLLVSGAMLGVGLGFYLFFRALSSIGNKSGR